MARRKKREPVEEPVILEVDRDRAAIRTAWLEEYDRREALPRLEVWSRGVDDDGRGYTRIEIVPYEGKLT